MGATTYWREGCRSGRLTLWRGTLARVVMPTDEPRRNPPQTSRSAPAECAEPPRPSADEETRLLGRIQRGDAEALRALYDHWADTVYSIATHLTGAPEDAEEVVEKTFTQVWNEASRYDPARGSVGTWITLIARSRALDGRRTRRRRQQREAASFEGAATADAATPPPSPLQQTAASERRRMVDRALGHLPDDQQRVVRLTFFAGLSQREIADELGLPLGTVKTRVRLAFAKLRGTLSVLREAES